MTPQELSQKIQVLSKQYNLAIRSNKWTDALQIAKNLVKLNAKSAVCYNYRGFAYFKLGQFAKSRLDFEHVLRLDTSNKNALSMLEKINNIEPQVVEEEMETVPISNLDVKAYNEANQETKILASTKSLEIEDAFIEETTTQIIYEQPIVAVAQITEPQNTTIENNPKYLTHNISKPMLIGGGVTLVIGVFIGIFLLGEPANIKNENVQEIASYTTIFDNPHVEPIKDINFDINTTKESDPQENVVATIENMNDVPDMVAKPNLEESNTTKEIVLEVKAKVEETVFEIKSDPIKKDLVEEDINNKVINEIAKQESVSQEKIEKKSIPIDFMGVTIDLAVSRNIVFVIDNSSSMQKMNGQYKKNRWALSIEAFHDFLPQLIKNNIFLNVIVYNTKPVSFYQELEIASDKTKEKTQALFQKNSPTMGTNIYDAVVAAMQMKNVDTVVLICDGPPGSGKYVTYNDIIQNITAQNNKNIIIHTISLFALGSTKKFLQQLAQKNNGTFYSH